MADRPKAFISYSHADRAQIVPLASYLDRLGLQVWMDTKELTAGDSIVEAVSEAISAADIYVVCLSPSSVDSPWVRHELDLAMTLEVERGQPKVLPVLLAKTDIPSALTGRLYVDLGRPADAGREEIRRFVDSNFAGLEKARPDDGPRLVIASVELELTRDTALSFGGLNPEVTRQDVEEEAFNLSKEVRRSANGILLNFVPVAQINPSARHFQFPNGEIAIRTEDRPGELSGTISKRVVAAVQMLNPQESKLEELVSSKLASLGVSKATYAFTLEPSMPGLGQRSLERLQQRYVLLGWDPDHGADLELDDELRLSVLVSDDQVHVAVETRYPFQFDRRARDFSVRKFVDSLIADA